MTTDMLKFDLPKNQSSIIKVIGVGGGGSNAVNHMFHQGIEGVDFLVCNTDSQALEKSPVPNKVQLGTNLTEGRGAGSIPEVGKNAALEDIDRIKEILGSNTKMLFVTAGMGGGTGTGATPVIARASKEMGILTVGIVTLPFAFEGRKRRQQAEEGIRELSAGVDTLLVISNDRLRELYGNLSVSDAFAQADNVLTTGAKGIAEIITRTGKINVDFADVRTVMSESGAAIMGNGQAEGEGRSMQAVEAALASPLLNDNQIRGAKNILLNITSGKEEILMDEITEVTDYIQEEAGSQAEIIWGLGKDESLGSSISVTLVATGFGNKQPIEVEATEKKKKVINMKEEEQSIEWDGPFKTDENQRSRIAAEQKDERRATIEQHGFGVYTRPDAAVDANQYRRVKTSAKTNNRPSETTESTQVTKEEKQEQIQERDERLKTLSIKLKTPEGLAELEGNPAYRRRKVNLSHVTSSKESQISRYTLNESGEHKTQIKSNNSFLHDNVD